MPATPNETIRLLLLGTRTFAVEVADIVSETPGLALAGFIENLERDRCGTTLEGLPIHWVDELATLAAQHRAACALSTTRRWKFVEQAAAHGMRFATIIHPSALISARSTLGEGTIVNRAVTVACHTQIGRHVILNRGALVGHHTRIGDYATIQPGANIAGLCSIGRGTYIGMGAVVIDKITIGANVVVGAGAVVTADVPDNVQVVGVPARVVKADIDGK